jgi:hypothetical protein
MDKWRSDEVVAAVRADSATMSYLDLTIKYKVPTRTIADWLRGKSRTRPMKTAMKRTK